ncbi:hypothetical protein Dvina_32090 [Dactylosporangium vinaceum]|uniref:Uncharacterized protein n=1 Tax=Dactylosporangium vinaceum TaxID=53362 RepID=A0ABV5MAL0_9ACTN|nr:hypothetical protein [Dactylosporangium vinaceum]UAB92937.1 hypothetical protein Dvina_32090 [Dactylosporangium vinaceum]
MTDHAERGLSRRRVLTVAGLLAGVGTVQVVLPATAAHADPDHSLTPVTLEPLSEDPVTVLAGDRTTGATVPRQLAVRILNTGAELPAGTTIELSFDRRVYTPAGAALLTLGPRRVKAASTVARDAATGLLKVTVTLGEALPALREGQPAAVLVVAAANAARYPADLVRDPAEATVELGATAGSPRVRRSLRAGPPKTKAAARVPWGLELSGAWGRHSAGEFVYHYPVLLRVLAVGPGRTPVPVAFSVALDPALVSEVKVTALRLNDKPLKDRTDLVSTVRSTSVYETLWRTPVRLDRGDVLEISLGVALLTPPANLPAVKQPLVTLAAMGTDPAQRQTGRHTLTRLDSVWGPVEG